MRSSPRPSRRPLETTHCIPDTWVTLLPLHRRGHALEGVSRHGRAAPVCYIEASKATDLAYQEVREAAQQVENTYQACISQVASLEQLMLPIARM
jgi:hypothetical protein